MDLVTSDRRRARGVRATVVTAMMVGVTMGLPGGISGAGTAGPTRASNVTDPWSGHPYRHGAIPRPVVGSPSGPVASGAGAAASAPAGSSTAGSSRARVIRGRKLIYRGGAIVTGQPKVYLVFWGSQWATQSTSGGYRVFSGDPTGLAPNLQAFFAGIGTNNELWSTIAGEYCQGVGIGTVSCSLSAPHVSYPSADVLAGVWEDTSYTPPTGPPGDASTPGVSGQQLGQEAANAAGHFGDTSANAQYVIVSPTGTNPDGWSDPQSGFCAYHSSTTGVGLSGPEVAFTNLPYQPDAGSACGAGAVNNPGSLDGVTLTAGHEYVETLTDPFVTPAWLDARGQEIGDKCESLNAGDPGGLFDLSLATGTFAVQGMWANDAGNGHGGCMDVHSPVLVSNPGKQLGAVGTGVSLQISAIDLRSGQSLTYSASGLPAGLSINSASGLISGTPTAHGRVLTTVVVTASSRSASTSFKWTVKRH